MSTQETLARLEQAYASLQNIFRTVLGPRATAVIRRTEEGATLDEVQGEIDAVRAEFDSAYAQVRSLRDQASALDPRPSAFISQLEQSLNVNGPNNYQALGRAVTRAGQNTNQRNAETAAKAAADQGPGTDSAGVIGAEAGVARDQGASSQNPPGPGQQQTPDGSIISQPTSTVPTNAVPNQTVTPLIPGSPPVIVTGQPTQTSDVLPNTPVAAAGSLQQPSTSAATQFYVYKAVSVISNFSGGKFTQELEGVALQIPIPGFQRQNGLLSPLPSDNQSDLERQPQPDVITNTIRNPIDSSSGAGGSSPTGLARPLPSQPQNIAAGGNIPTVADTTATAQSIDASGAPTISSDADQEDPTIFGPQQIAPPDSAGQDVSVPVSPVARSEGSATTIVGGFTIKALVQSNSGGAAYTVSIGGSTEFAFSADQIFQAATKLILAGKGGDDQAVIAWINSGGARQLEAQALAQISPISTTTSTVNLARES